MGVLVVIAVRDRISGTVWAAPEGECLIHTELIRQAEAELGLPVRPKLPQARAVGEPSTDRFESGFTDDDGLFS